MLSVGHTELVISTIKKCTRKRYRIHTYMVDTGTLTAASITQVSYIIYVAMKMIQSALQRPISPALLADVDAMRWSEAIQAARHEVNEEEKMRNKGTIDPGLWEACEKGMRRCLDAVRNRGIENCFQDV